MSGTRTKLVAAVAALCASLAFQNLWARDLTITLPRRSELTPVQRLNREGVDAIRRHQYDKAEALFYKAYLYDPADPFTLNNLGYISELQGQLDRAERFYAMASQQADHARIARSNQKELEGKPMVYALSDLKDAPMRINRMNFDAIALLSEDRGIEAGSMLRRALSIDPQNPFTLNNLGVASETMGDFEAALRYYDQAAHAHSKEPVIVTQSASWRGKPVSEMAASNERRLKDRMKSLNTAEAQAAMYNLRGVSAVNQNDWQAAREDFLKAYALDPYSAFSLNNAGYVAEKEGDLETAQFFYARARQADNADARVGLASQEWADGKQLTDVALTSDQSVSGKIEQDSEARHLQKAPIILRHRDGTPVVPAKPPQPKPPAPDAGAPAPPDATPPQQ